MLDCGGGPEGLDFTGVPNLFEPSDTFGILSQGTRHNYKKAATVGGASHKTSFAGG